MPPSLQQDVYETLDKFLHELQSIANCEHIEQRIK